MPARFDEMLEVDLVNGVQVVRAGGPLDPNVAEVVELCVWVVQRDRLDQDDAVANAMRGEAEPAEVEAQSQTHQVMSMTAGVNVAGRGTSTAHWDLILDDREGTQAVDFVTGPATAFAIGVFLSEEPDVKRRAFMWSESVRLRVPAAAAGSMSSMASS
jgi:hypothetical protein